MRTIPLTFGQVAKVSQEDYAFLNFWRWKAVWGQNRRGYFAVRTAHTEVPRSGREPQLIYMHLVVAERMGLETEYSAVDHVGRHSTLNNQRENLRGTLKAVEVKNHGPISRYTGVHWHKAAEKWRATLRINRKPHHLGYFDDETDAARMHDRAAGLFHGRFARINIPKDLPEWYGTTLRSKAGAVQ